MLIEKKLLKRKGMSLIEVLVALFVVTLLEATIILAFNSSFSMTKFSRNKISATELVNERMEALRNLPYNNLATINGPIYPPGTLADDYQVKRGSSNYNIHTVISYVDDPFDGNATGTIVGKPTDLYPYDYKKIEVTVRLVGNNTVLAIMSSNVAAKAAETPSNTGIISICVIDANSTPVAQAVIKIINTEADPPVNITVTADNNGCIMIPNLPEDRHNNYHLEATKPGYSTDMTYERTAQNPNALQPDVNVIAQEVTNQTFIIDRFGLINVEVVDIAGNPVSNTDVLVKGEKLMYFNPETEKYSETHRTDANGMIHLDSMEFDDYSFTVSGWSTTVSVPYQPVHLAAATTLSVKLVVDQSSTQPRISGCDPLSGRNNAATYLKIKGSNIGSSATMKLVSGTGQVIQGTGISVTGHNQMDVRVDLTGATIGPWDIVITNTDGQSVTQSDGFMVTS